MNKCFVGGWGALSQGGIVATALQSVAVHIYSDAYCYEHSNYGEKLHFEEEFCAGYLDGGKGQRLKFVSKNLLLIAIFDC